MFVAYETIIAVANVSKAKLKAIQKCVMEREGELSQETTIKEMS